MASQKQIEANRRNAAKSTGPKTAVGKARSASNALRHGFATPRWRVQVDEPVDGTIEDQINSLWEKGFKIDCARWTILNRIRMSNLSKPAMLKLLKQAVALERYSRPLETARRKLLKEMKDT